MFKRISIISIILILIAFSVWYFLRSIPQNEISQNGSRFEFPTQEERQKSSDRESSSETINQTTNNEGLIDEIPTQDISTTGFSEEDVLVRKITNERVSGGHSFGTREDLNLTLRYIEEKTGHVYEYLFEENAIRKVTSNDIPSIKNAMWLDENRVLVQYFSENDLKTFAGEIKLEESGEGNLVGNFLPNNISGVAIAASEVVGSDLFYTTENSEGTTGYVSNFSGQDSSQVFFSPIKDWLIDWPSRFVLSLNTKPSGNVPGYLYEIDSTSRSSTDTFFENSVKNKDGLLTLLSHNGERFFYSEKKAGKLASGFIEKVSGKEINIDTQTITEKCVWSKDNIHIYCGAPDIIPGANYPDDWYAGLVRFDDNILRIDSRNGSTDILLVSGFDVQEEIDAIDLFLSEEEDYLFFRNKWDNSLWMISLPSF